jgi:hypothetical protein
LAAKLEDQQIGQVAFLPFPNGGRITGDCFRGRTLRLHRTSLYWLDTELSKPFDGRTVVVTHFAPHRRCVPAKFEGSDLSPYFVTDLAWLMEKHRISVWCFGHTHSNCDFMAENGCRVISNQLGYQSEGCEGFRADLVIEV